MLNLSEDVFLYSQNLDNEGGTIYWKISISDNKEEVLTDDCILGEIRHSIDYLTGLNKFRLKNFGEILIVIEPMTLDVNDRASPVVVLCNVLYLGKDNIDKIFELIEGNLKRELSKNNYKSLDWFKGKYLSQPTFFRRLKFLFSNRVVKLND